MIFDVLALALVVGAFVAARRSRHVQDAALLPPEDQPPLEAHEPLPSPGRLDRYVGDGLARLERYVAARDDLA